MATGVILLLLGLFVFMRTIVKDSSGKNLVGHLTSL